MPLPLLVLAAAMSFLLSLGCCELMKHTGVVDAPDGERKLQARPVPRLGGIGVILAIAVMFTLAALIHAFAPAMLGGDWLPGLMPAAGFALAAALCLAMIGAVDDVFGMGAVTKLALMALVCVAAPFSGVAIPALTSPFGDLAIPAVMIIGSALWLLVFSNAANFMDGSNGLSLGCLAIMFTGLGASLLLTGEPTFPAGLVVIIAAINGFLVHNLRGTLYAGDAGAFGLGGLFAALALIAALPVWTVATLALPFLIDVLLTIILRTRRGEKLFVAHRDHAYQALIKAGWSHIEVAMAWWSLTAACAVAAYVGAAGGGALPFSLFLLFGAILTIGWMLIPRKARDHMARNADG